MVAILRELKGKFFPALDFGTLKGQIFLIELNDAYEGRRYGVMNENTQGRRDVEKRLGRIYNGGDPVVIKRFELGSQTLHVLEVG